MSGRWFAFSFWGAPPSPSPSEGDAPRGRYLRSNEFRKSRNASLWPQIWCLSTRSKQRKNFLLSYLANAYLAVRVRSRGTMKKQLRKMKIFWKARIRDLLNQFAWNFACASVIPNYIDSENYSFIRFIWDTEINFSHPASRKMTFCEKVQKFWTPLSQRLPPS